MTSCKPLPGQQQPAGTWLNPNSQGHQAGAAPAGWVAACVLVQAGVAALICADKGQALAGDHELGRAHRDIVKVLGQLAQQLALVAAPAVPQLAVEGMLESEMGAPCHSVVQA